MSTWAVDLDGVVWRGAELLPGADVAIARLGEAGVSVVFCTNHACSAEVKRAQLAEFGVLDAAVVTSADAAAARCATADLSGATVLVLGDESLVTSLAAEPLEVIDVWDLPDGEVPPVDAVVVGATARWDRSRVGMVADAVRSGARFLATNDDPTYPVAGASGPRLLPGNGALVAAVETAAGRRAEVTGKPHTTMADLLVARHGPIEMVVGDKPETDGELAVRLGARFGLVLSGVTTAEHLPVRPEPSVVAPDLATLVDRHLGAVAPDGRPATGGGAGRR